MHQKQPMKTKYNTNNNKNKNNSSSSRITMIMNSSSSSSTKAIYRNMLKKKTNNWMVSTLKVVGKGSKKMWRIKVRVRNNNNNNNKLRIKVRNNNMWRIKVRNRWRGRRDKREGKSLAIKVMMINNKLNSE